MLLNNRIPAYYILNKVKYDLIYVLIVSLLVLFITDRYNEFIPEMPLTIPAFIGTAIARTVEINVKQLLKETEIPKPSPSEKFYQL